MEQIVAFFAPKSKGDFVAKWAFLYLLINIFAVVIEILVRGWSYHNMFQQQLITALVANPFILLSLAMLSYQRALQGKLLTLAATDMLTGLRNRRAFLADATEAHAMGDGGALLLLDADHFKQVNDTYGHDVGDMCLCEIANHLRSMVRTDDVVGRLGGEEFGIYLRNASAERARAVGERICRGFMMEPATVPARFKLTLSAGAVLARTGNTIEQGLTVADRALYLAKEAGRARVIFAPF